jgi:hypothetical protein
MCTYVRQEKKQSWLKRDKVQVGPEYARHSSQAWRKEDLNIEDGQFSNRLDQGSNYGFMQVPVNQSALGRWLSQPYHLPPGANRILLSLT